MRSFGVWLLVISLVSNLLSLALPLALLQVYDRILPTSQYGTAATLFAVVVIAMVLDGFLRFVRSRASYRASIVREHSETIGLARLLISADVMRLQSISSGARRDGFNAISQSRDLGSVAAAVPLFDAPFAVIFLALVWFIGGALALVPIVVLVPFSLAALYIAREQRGAALKRSGTEQTMMSRIGDLLTGFVDFKGFGYAGRLLNRVDEALRMHAVRAEQFERRDSLLTDLAQAASLAATVGITVWGAQIVIDTSFTTGGLAACSILGGRSVSAWLALFSSMVRFGAARAASDQVHALRQGLSSATSGSATPAADDASARIELDAVVLHRAGVDVPVTSCMIPLGATVLLRGDRPASEVLLMLAIAGLEKPDAGTIKTAGRAAFVADRPTIFRGSVLDNLTGWEASRADAARGLALELGLAHLIDRLPDGVLTNVAGGITSEMSAGIVKRIALVRALVSGAPLIALQQPEVDLDVDGRRRLLHILNGRTGQDTVLLTTADQAFAAIATHTIAIPPSTSGVSAS